MFFVAEANPQLFGRVGIGLFAGPIENLVIANKTLTLNSAQPNYYAS
jgi:histidinol dehydrogenase